MNVIIVRLAFVRSAFVITVEVGGRKSEICSGHTKTVVFAP